MDWWKKSFEKINSELELVKRKKEALEKLVSSGVISQPTYEYYSKELEEAEKEIESRKKALIERVNSRIETLEKQLQVLEMLFADVELSYAVGEMDEGLYSKQRETLATGIEFARKELESLKEFTTSLEAPKIETAESEISVEEAVAETTTEEEAAEEPVEVIVQEQPLLEEIETPTEETQEESCEVPPAASEIPVEDLTFQADEEGTEQTEGQNEDLS